MKPFDRLTKLNIDFNAILKRVLERHAEEIEDLNRNQLTQGKRSDGSQLPPYTPAYAKRKGKALTPKTLNDTGTFHNEIFTTFFEKSFNVESNNWKSDIIESNWGQKIFGLTDENKRKLAEMIRDEVASELRKEMFHR
jgi:hypothetical protein